MSNYPLDSTFYRPECRRFDINVHFKTYSDARVAALFLDNMHNFPTSLFEQIFDVVTDPQFKPSDVTFTKPWEIFDHVSTYRRGVALDRGVAKPPEIKRSSGVVPPVILGLVVDAIVQAGTPLCAAADEPSWKKAFSCDRTDLRNMTLVHRSWTDIAQRGLRRRAIVPYKQIKRFLLSPLCGIWITEMIIYWTVRACDKVTSDDIDLLKALFARTPNVRSLAFNTSLACHRSLRNDKGLNIRPCLGAISSALPHLQDLYLEHFEWPGIDSEEKYTLVWCDTLQYLYECIPRMLSLKSLIIEGWTSSDADVLDWNEHPPSSLKAVDLMLGSLGTDMSGQIVAWLLRPRGNFSLQSLSICGGEYPSEDTCEELRLLLQTSLHLEQLSVFSTPALDEVFPVSRVPSLDLFYDKIYWNDHIPSLPSTLEHLGIHITKGDAHEIRTNWVNFICPLIERISILPGLRTLIFIIRPGNPNGAWKLICDGLDSRFYRRSFCTSGPADEPLPVELTKFCEGRNIHLACVNAVSLG